MQIQDHVNVVLQSSRCLQESIIVEGVGNLYANLARRLLGESQDTMDQCEYANRAWKYLCTRQSLLAKPALEFLYGLLCIVYQWIAGGYIVKSLDFD